MAKVPDVKNYHYEYARKILEQEGFIIEQKYEMSSDGTETSYGFAPDIPMDFSDCYKATTAEELFRRLVA
jgi:hypothetical protein